MRKLSVLLVAFVLFCSIPITVISKNQDTFISETAQQACIEYGEEYGICPELLMAMIESESSGKPKAKNGGCVGLMQINKRFHEERMERLDITDLYDEKQNILVGTDYLSELFAEYEDVYMVLMAYNMGQSNAEKLFNDGVYESEYARKICERSAELEQIHGK